MATDLELCSQALVELGCDPISSFSEATTESKVARTLYAPYRDALLSAHTWGFALDQVTLPRLVEGPRADYTYAYQLPSNLVCVKSCGTGARGRGLTYRVVNGTIQTDADRVTLTYIFRALESDFPPYFVIALVKRLEAAFCMPLTESTTRAEWLDQKAEVEFRRAKSIDSQQQTPVGIEDFPLIEVRG